MCELEVEDGTGAGGDIERQHSTLAAGREQTKVVFDWVWDLTKLTE